jgi:hypothetical protein
VRSFFLKKCFLSRKKVFFSGKKTLFFWKKKRPPPKGDPIQDLSTKENMACVGCKRPAMPVVCGCAIPRHMHVECVVAEYEQACREYEQGCRGPWEACRGPWEAAGPVAPTRCSACFQEYEGEQLLEIARIWARRATSTEEELAARAKEAYALSFLAIEDPACAAPADAAFVSVIGRMRATFDPNDELLVGTMLNFTAHRGTCERPDGSDGLDRAARLEEAELMARSLVVKCATMGKYSDFAMAVLARILINRVANAAVVREATGANGAVEANGADEAVEAAMFAEAERLLLGCADAPAHARLLATMYVQQGRFGDAVAQARVSLAHSRLQFGDADEETLCDIALVRHIAMAAKKSGSSAAVGRTSATECREDRVANVAECAACGSTSRMPGDGHDGPTGPMGPMGPTGPTTRRPKWCSGCRKVRYCSAECQKAHRPEHRDACSNGTGA